MPTTTEVTQENTPKELNFATVLKFAAKLNGIIFKRQEAVRHAQLDGYAVILTSLQESYPNAKGFSIDSKRPKDYFNEVKHKYKDWKNDKNKLLQIMAEHYRRIESDIKKRLDSAFQVMAKKMTREDFLNFAKQPGVITEAECTNPPTDEYTMVLYAQACLESGRFTSYKYKNDGNMFGMQASTRRRQLYVSKYEVKSGAEKGWWPEYRDQRQSFVDRLNWDAYNRIQYITFEKYVKFVLGDNINQLKYASDPEYGKKWWGWVKVVFDEAGMVRPYVDPLFYSDSINPNDTGDDGSDPGGSAPAGEGLGWKLWAGIAAVAAIVIYAIFNRD